MNYIKVKINYDLIKAQWEYQRKMSPVYEQQMKKVREIINELSR